MNTVIGAETIILTLVIGGDSQSKDVVGGIGLSLQLHGKALVTYPANRGSEAAISLSLGFNADFVIENHRKNWVAWSKVGEASFVLDLVNDAGFMPMKWDGYVFGVKQLDDMIVVYGTRGVSAIFPASASPTFGLRELVPIGIKSKNAFAGTIAVHYFIDRLGALWQLNNSRNPASRRVVRLGYEEYLEPLVNPCLFFDEYLNRLLISSTAIGYIYTDKGMGGGYGNLSGYCYDAGTILVASPTEISTPLFNFTTDIVDFGERGQKTIESIQVGTDAPEVLEVAYDYRYGITQSFVSTHWIRLNREGVAYLRCAGTEFRIKLRSVVLQALEVDYLNVQYKLTDRRFRRSAKNVAGDLVSNNTPQEVA